MGETNYRCSVVIPVYNGIKFIEKTIQSCLDQTVPIEIIVINDGSTDNSEKIILPYVDEGVIYIKNDVNLGLMKSLNRAVKYTHSDYLLFLGHDDMISANHVALMLKEFDTDTAFVHCNADLIDKDDTIIGLGVNDKRQLRKMKYIKEYLALSNIIHSTGAIINKKYFDKIGGWDEQFKNYGEWLLWIKLANVGKVNYSTKVRALYRRHDTNITNSFEDENIKPELMRYYQLCQSNALLNINNMYKRYFVFSLLTLRNILARIKSWIKRILKNSFYIKNYKKI